MKMYMKLLRKIKINFYQFCVFVICLLCYIKLVTTFFPIHICTLEVARECDLSIYDGIITIENTIIENPFRVQLEYPKQLILRFDDISFPVDDFEEAREIHIYKSLQFADENKNGSLLIHCHAGISRSSAIALAIISNKLGKGNEKEAVKILQEINPYCRPNKLLVQMTDKILEREEELLKAVQDEVSFTF